VRDQLTQSRLEFSTDSRVVDETVLADVATGKRQAAHRCLDHVRTDVAEYALE
jgi:hypothetical protein